VNKFKVGDKVVVVNPNRYANQNNVEAIKRVTNVTLVVQSVCSDTDVVFAGLPGKMARPWLAKDLRLSPEVWANVNTGPAVSRDAWVLEWDQDEQTDSSTPESPDQKQDEQTTATKPDAPDQYAPDMTLRDYFAAQAMSGLIAAQAGTYSINPLKPSVQRMLAQTAYSIADAMLKARAEGPC